MNDKKPTGARAGLQFNRTTMAWTICIFSLLVTALYVIRVGGALTEQMQNWPILHAELDFPSYYLSTGRLLQGEDIYGGLREQAQQTLGMEHYFIDVAITPPTFILVAAPLALLPYPTAWTVWQCLSLIALVLSIVLIARELALDLSPPGWICLSCAVLLFPPLTSHMFYAHTELFLLLLLTGAWILLRRDRPLPAGALVGLAGAVRLYPFILLLYLLQRRDWKALASALVTGLGLAGLAGVVAGPSSYIHYLDIMREEIPHLYPRSGNLSLWGNVHKLATIWPLLGQRPLLRDAVAYTLFLAVVGITLWITRKAGKSRRSIDLAYGLFITAALLASPLSWIYYQVLLYLPLLILLAALRRSKPPRTAVLVALGMGLTASLTPLFLGGRPNLPRAVQRLQAFLPTLTPIGIYLALLLQRTKERRGKIAG